MAASGSVAADRLLAASAAAAAYYRRQLLAADGAERYLQRRGLGAAAREDRWCLGYAPAQWAAVTAHLRCAGFTDAEIETAGLASRSRRGDLVDRFRNRLIFPLRRVDGTVVGFVGRDLPAAATPPGSVHYGRSDAPKYLNGPETPIFRKSQLLYGLAEQRAELVDGGAIPVLVEGPMDVLAVAESCRGRRAAVAAVGVCGTALSAGQVQLLAEMRRGPSSRPIAVSFDADLAGWTAAARALELLREWPGPVLATELAAGLDLAGLLERRGRHLTRAAVTVGLRSLLDAVIERRLREVESAPDASIEARVAALRSVAGLVAGDRTPAELTRRIAVLATRLDLHHGTVSAEIAEVLTPSEDSRRSSRGAERRGGPASAARAIDSPASDRRDG